MTKHHKEATFHANRALEALQDPRDGDDDVEAARTRHLFGLLETLARMPADNNPQCLAATMLYARTALCCHLRNEKAKAIRALQQVMDGHLLRPYVGVER